MVLTYEYDNQSSSPDNVLHITMQLFPLASMKRIYIVYHAGRYI